MVLILASASPRRAALLSEAGFSFEVVATDIDEAVRPDEPPDAYVRRLAEAKARAVARRSPGRLVLGADTTVVAEGEILGKPRDRDDARRMLRLLSGRAHEVLTGVAVAGPDDRTQSIVARTTVWFSRLDEAEVEWYIGSGEPMDKAGGYAIQGRAARFVTRIDGSYSNVVGLPVAVVYALLRRNGHA